MNEHQNVERLLRKIFRLKQDLRRLTSYRDELWGSSKASNERSIEETGEALRAAWEEYQSINSSTRWVVVKNLLPGTMFAKDYGPFEDFLLGEKQNLER